MPHPRVSRRSLLAIPAFALGVVGIMTAMSSADALQTDQAQRDLTRVFSEVLQRAISYRELGQVTRPEFASTKIDASVPNLSEGWTPSCDIEIGAAPSDPRRNLQALVVVPRDRISNNGADFTVFAIFVGQPAVTSALLANPPTWLKDETGGYSSLEADLNRILSISNITVQSTECEAFTFSEIHGVAK